MHYSGSDFWIVNALLAPFPLDLLSAPASTAYMEVEHVFSVCGELAAGKRNWLMKGLKKRIFFENEHEI